MFINVISQIPKSAHVILRMCVLSLTVYEILTFQYLILKIYIKVRKYYVRSDVIR